MDIEGFSTPVANESRRSLARPRNRKSLSTPADKAVNLSPHVVLTDIVVLNDDDAERRIRQRERVRELQRNILNSPATPAERRQSLTSGIAGLTNIQLAEHYSNCMKLSAENKITIKNAFGLHLIDYMSELLKKNDGSTNFQMASCTLDASAKIYAYRVDCVHADVFKMAGGLGLAEEPKNTDNPADLEMDDSAEKTVKKKKKTKKSATVETNVKSLNLNKLEIGFQADAVFLKMSRAFEEGGINGLLFNISAKNDSSELLLDASAPYRCVNEPREFLPLSIPKDTMGPLSKLQSSEEVQLCPSIANFSFIDKNTFMDDEDGDATRKKTDHTFDIDSVPEPIEKEMECDMDVDNNQVFDSDDEAAMDQDAPGFSVGNSSTLHVNCAIRKSGDNVSAIRLESVADLTQVLAGAPSEYSYFDHSLLTAWAGPNHWRLRPLSKCKASLAPPRDVSDKRSKKSSQFLDFEDLDKIKEENFVIETQKVKLSKSTLKGWSVDKTTLPDDLFYEPKKLWLLSHADILLSYAAKSQTDVSNQVGQYDYDNACDRENFCPDVPSSQEDDDDDSAAFPAAGQSFADPSRNSSVVQDATNNESAEAYTGSNLVEEPQKVEKVQIGYAKMAKKIDVKRLKQAMWDILTGRGAENKENVDENEPSPTKMKDPIKFMQLYRSLPSRISSNMAKNLSVPVAFVCFLHLANEKNLQLINQEDMKDFTITQG